MFRKKNDVLLGKDMISKRADHKSEVLLTTVPIQHSGQREPKYKSSSWRLFEDFIIKA